MRVELPAFAAESPIATWTCDRASLAVIDANDAAIAALGWPRAELMGTSLRALAIDAAAMDAALVRAERDRETAIWRVRDAAGASIELEAAVTAYGDGLLVQVVSAGTVALSRLGALVERISGAISMSSREGVVEYVSPAVEKMLGVTPRAMVGTRGGRLTHADDIARARPAYESLLRAPGSTTTFVSRMASRDGGDRWIESTTTNLLDDPVVRSVVAQFHDVTDRVEAQAQLEQARRRFEYLLSATSAVTYTASPESPYGATFISDNVATVLGYAPAQFVADPGFWSDRLHPDERDAVLADVGAIAERERHVLEYRFLHADGGYRWLHDDVRVVRDPDGRARELIGFFFDVTARCEAEAAVRRSETNFRALIENAPLAIVVHRDDRIIYVNAPLVALLGYARADDLIGRPPMSIIAPSDRARAQPRIQYLAVTPGTPHTPLSDGTALRADGTTVAVEVEGVKLDFDGTPASVVLMRDVSERRAMVARLATSDRLASVGTLAAGVAHEINNPLAFVLTNLSILADELPAILDGSARARLRSADVERLVKDARDGAARIRALVGDLRTLSHPDQTTETAVDVRDVIETCLRMAENEIRHRARLVTRLGEAPRVDGNASRLGQVFLNLIINAVQAIPEGELARHEIRVGLTRGPRGEAIGEIGDTGGGIAPELLPRIFDPFFTTKPVGLGTGLGLAICHGIVRSMRGEIEVESEVGRGTTFRVILPASRAGVPAASPEVAPAAPSQHFRVLVIDDERAIGRSLEVLLGEHHDVAVDTRAADALARILAGATYDAILCDLMMPEMNGIRFHDELAAFAPGLARRIVFLTGGAFTPSSKEFLERVPNARLDKPFDIDELFAIIDATCAMARDPGS